MTGWVVGVVLVGAVASGLFSFMLFYLFDTRLLGMVADLGAEAGQSFREQ